MKLPFSLWFGKKKEQGYFLSLLLGEEKIGATMFEEVAGQVRVVSRNEAYFSDSIETASLEEFLDVLDKAISVAEAALPQNIEVRKTIFGVKESWVEEAKIKQEYLAKLKKASEALSLSPIGFLIIHEAIAHLMQQDEGAPVSAILVEINAKHLAVTLIRAGRIVATRRTRVQDDVVKTTDRLMHHFQNIEVLPSRIIVFGNEAEEISQKFIAHSWSKSLPFLHVPQIAVLPVGFDAHAVLSGAARQMGFEVLSEDITKLEETTFEELGFAKEDDVATIQKPSPEEPRGEEAGGLAQGLTRLKEPTQNLIALLVATFGKLLRLLRHLLTRLPSPRGKLLILAPLLALVALLLLLAYLFLLRATVVIRASATTLEKKEEVTFLGTSAIEGERRTISATFPTIAKEGSLTVPTTGKKEVGEKAKGTVTIFSRFTEERVFSSGTTLTSSNDLQFLVDKDIRVASASADASAPPVTATAAITAKSIGKEYNLPSGTKFTLAQAPQTLIVAKNDNAFGGGSKREVTAVGKQDVVKAESELPKRLETQVKQELLSKLSEKQTLLPRFVRTTLTNRKLSKDVGEEAESLTLSATVRFEAVVFKKGSIEDIAKTLFPQAADVSYSVEEVRSEDKQKVVATVTMKASLLPFLDTKKLAGSITGKSFKEAEDLLLQLPKVSDVTIALAPPVPFLPRILPQRKENIAITIQHE